MIGYTEVDDFPYKATVSRAADGWILKFESVEINDDVESMVGWTVELTKECLNRYCGQQELAEGANIYLVLEPNSGHYYFFNKLARSYNTKADGSRFASQSNITVAAQIYIPYVNSPVEEWSWRINCRAGAKNTFPADAVKIEASQQSFHNFSLKVMPSLRIHNVKRKSEHTEVTVQLTQNGKDVARAGVRVFANATCGYINKAESHTDEAGRVTFKAQRLLLDTNDEMVAEFGFKFFTNICSTTIV